MSVCIETSTVLSQPVASTSPTNTKLSEVVVSSIHSSSTTSSLNVETKSDQSLCAKNITKLVVTSQHGPTNTSQVLQKVVNSPLITVLNSTGPLTVVKSLCVTSVVSTASHYTLVNSTPLNVTTSMGKAPTITVLNCGPLNSPVTVKTLSTQQTAERPASDFSIKNTLQNTPSASAVIENRGHNVFVKNTCSEPIITDKIPQSRKLLMPKNYSPNNGINNLTVTNNPLLVNGQRNKLNNVQVPGSSQPNDALTKTPNIPLTRYSVTSRQKIMGSNNTPSKHVGKQQCNVLKPILNSPLKSINEKSSKLLHSSIQKNHFKSGPSSNYLQKSQQGIKTLSPLHKNIPGQVQRTGSGLKTIPPQRPQKFAPKPNYIGKHAAQAHKVKQSGQGKLKSFKTPLGNVYGYHSTPISEKQLTFNQALTAQIIETLSNSNTPPPSSRFDMLPSRYDSAFNCPDKKVSDPMKTEDKAKSGLDALSLICQAVLLDHNYNATLPSESPIRPTPPTNTQAQVNGISPTSIYTTFQSKRRQLPSGNSLSSMSLSNKSINTSVLGSHGCNEDDAASDVSDLSERKHDTEGEETDTAPEAEDVKNDEHYGDYVTRCICGFLHDDGYMVECDRCKVWQHVQCVVKNRQIPDEYLCEECDPDKPIDRHKARLIQQQWIRERQLIEPKISKESNLKETRSKNAISESDSSDCEHVARNNNVITKNRTLSGRKKTDNVKVKREARESVQRRQKRKERKIVRRKPKFQIKQQQSHSDDENQDTWSAHLPQLRQWIEKYEEAVTNHYSPELRARISSIRVNGTHVDSNIQYDSTVCKCRVHTQPLTEIKYLVSSAQLAPNTPIIELRGKYMLSTQHRSGSLNTRLHTQRPGPFLFFYKLLKDNTEVCVDTRTYGNSARFIRRSCKPNAELRHCIEKGVLHLYIVSITAVEKNCELTIKHESHDLAAVGTTQIACACGCPVECTVNKTSINKNGEIPEMRKRRGRRTMSLSISTTVIKSPLKASAMDSDVTTTIEHAVPSTLPSVDEHSSVPVVLPEQEEIKEEKVDVLEPIEVKDELKVSEVIGDKSDIKTDEILEKPTTEDINSQINSIPVKAEVKKEKIAKDDGDKTKSPNITSVSTRRSSHNKSDKEENSKDDSKEHSNKLKKLSREERKLEAILRAIEQMEKADQKKQEHQAKQAHRRESEPGPCVKEDEKQENKVRRRKRRGRARTTSTNAQSRRSRLNSTDSYMTSGDENLLSPNDNLHPSRPSIKDDPSDNAAGLLLAFSNGDSEVKEPHKSPSQEPDFNLNSANSSPETQLSSACLLVQAAVEPLEPGFKFPKTKKGLMNEWLNKLPDSTQTTNLMTSCLNSHTVQSVNEELGNFTSNKNLTALAQAVGLYDSSSQQRGGNAKKRWLRQAISEDQSGDGTTNWPESPTISAAVAPPKKRKLPRESLSNDNSPPNTPTTTCPVKGIESPLLFQEISLQGNAELDSPMQTMETDTVLHVKPTISQKLNFTKSVDVSQKTPDNIGHTEGIVDPRLLKHRENILFNNSEHLVGTVEKTLSIFGFENTKTGITLPVKRKLSITEYRQRKKLTTDADKPDDHENDHSHDDNNSSESFKFELTPKPRSRSSSSSSSLSSCDDLVNSDINKAPAFNSEPTELERQREISSLRLKKAFGLVVDDELRKPSIIDVNSILKCDLESKLNVPSPLEISISGSPSYQDVSVSMEVGTVDQIKSPVLPSVTTAESPIDVTDTWKSDKGEETIEAPENPVTVFDGKVVKNETEESNMFYTPDDDDEDRGNQDPETNNYVPPFNNPVYPNSNFNLFASTIDDDSRYQSRNPSPPPSLEGSTFTDPL